MNILKHIAHRLFFRKSTFARWQMHFFGAFFLALGLTLGGYFTSEKIMNAFADEQATITRNTDTHFSQGTLSDTQVAGSGSAAYIELAGTSGPDGTLYKQAVTINNTATASVLTDYQIKLTINTAALIDAGKMDADCGDIRFLDSDDSTNLSYWMHGPCDDASTTIWVKVPSIPASSNDTIYMYYGGGATSESDGEAVFMLFDDFNDGTIDAVKWSETDQAGGDEITEANGKLKFTRLTDDAWDKMLYGNTTYSRADISFEADYEWTQNNGSYDALMFGWHDNGTGKSYTDLIYGYYNSGTGAPSTEVMYVYEDGSNRSGIVGSWTVNTDYDIRVRMRASGGAYYEYSTNSGGSWSTAYTSSYSSESNVRPAWSFYSGNHAYDNARIRKWTATEPSASFGSESVILPASGTWSSPTNTNVIDLGWNGGWGDGSTGSSTAFSATVASVTSNATIAFKIRVAATALALTSEAWSTIGTATSGTTFTADKDTMDALALDTGTNGRYVQIQAVYAQTDGNNPQLDSFSLTYMSDDTAPSSNASSLAMKKSNGGATVLSNGWTNGIEPYFSWTAGSDSQSDIKGYCIYLGTDTDGDPATSKGLLGTSPVSTTGTTCQFIISATNIDLSEESYQGVTWLTSSADPYFINIKAIDNAGNTFSASSAQFQFRFDSTKPTNPSFVSMPSDFVATEAATIIWPASGGDASADTHSGVSGLQYRIGSAGTWYGDSHTGDQDEDDLLTNDGTYTTIETPDFASIAEGNNLVYMRTWDTAGNVSTTYVTGVLKVNTIAPGVAQNIDVSPADSTTNSYAFTWDAPNTFTGQESNITYCYSINTAPTLNTCTYTSAGQTSLSAGAYATQPGTNTMYIVAKDEAGNINYDTYTSIEFVYSGSAPGIPANADISDISIKSSSNWKLTLSWDEPSDVGAGITSYKVFRSTSATSCSSSFASFSQVGTTAGTSYTDTDLSQTDYYYCIKACDSANSCGAASTTVTGFPDGKFTAASELTSGPTTSSITTQKATVTWSTGRTSDSKVAFGTSSGSYNSEEISNSTQTTSHTINITNLSAGTTYYYKAKWTDEDGNTGLSEEKSFTTEPAPTIKNVEITNVSISSGIVSFTAAGATEVKIYYGPTTTFGGLSEIATSTTESTYTVQLTGLEDDTKYFFKINAFDAEGTEYEGTILDFTTLPRPRITNVRVQEVPQAANPTMLVTWTSNTDISSIITYYPEGNLGAAIDEIEVARTSGTHRMLLKGLLANKRYVILVKGVDKAGNEAISDSQVFTTSTDTRPPVISELQVEGSITANKGENDGSVQLIVSWNTDEPSSSQIEFGEGSGTTYSQQTQEDKNLTFNHVVIISGLTPRKVYHLRAISRDEIGNTGRSIDTVTIAPKITDDALNLVLSNLRETFSFLEAFMK